LRIKEAGFLLLWEAGLFLPSSKALLRVIHIIFVLQFLRIAKVDALRYEDAKFAKVDADQGTNARFGIF